MFNKLIKPIDSFGNYVESDPEAFKVHKYTKEMLMKCDDFGKVGTECLEWVYSFKYDIVIMIAHNSKFDEKVLRNDFKQFVLKVPQNWIFCDSISFVKDYCPEMSKNTSLDELSKHLGIQNEEALHIKLLKKRKVENQFKTLVEYFLYDIKPAMDITYDAVLSAFKNSEQMKKYLEGFTLAGLKSICKNLKLTQTGTVAQQTQKILHKYFPAEISAPATQQKGTKNLKMILKKKK